jgi:hypothetical protein
LPLALPSPLYLLPANRTFIYIQSTLTRLLLLLGTVILTQSSWAKVIYGLAFMEAYRSKIFFAKIQRKLYCFLYMFFFRSSLFNDAFLLITKKVKKSKSHVIWDLGHGNLANMRRKNITCHVMAPLV